MEVKFHRIDRLYQEHKVFITAMADRVYSKGQVLKGEAVKELEQKIAKKVGRKHAIAVGSCTDALSLSLMALDINLGDYVIVPKFTFPASYTCLRRLDCSPVFADTDFEYFTMKLDKISPSDIKAIIIVNLFGQMGNMELYMEMAKKNKWKVIEDVAQSFTSSYNGIPAGKWGDVSCLSFDPTKILPAFGTAGMVLTDNDDIEDSVRYYHYKNWGTNSQISTFNAELLLYWLNFVDIWESRRIQIAYKYMKELVSIDEIELPMILPGSTHIWHKYVIKAKKRDHLKLYLQEQGIETKIHYMPHTKTLSLPIYPTLKDEEQEEVIKHIKDFYVHGCRNVH